MSKMISELLGATEPMFSMAIKQLEDASGRPGVDVKLTAEIIGQVFQKTADLKLDPKDTTGKELYAALLVRVKKDDENLAKVIGSSQKDSAEELLLKIKHAVEALNINKKCWVLKKSVAKIYLRKTPPKNIMKILGYRSVDSMLKNEDICEIFGALRFAESSSWLKTFNNHYKSLKPTDFETRDIQILRMPPEKWLKHTNNFVAKKLHNITHVKEMGIILILPTNNIIKDGLAITVMPLLVHYINEIRLYSSYFKLQQVKPNFAKIFIDTLNADPYNAAIMAGQNIHWRVIQRYFGKLDKEHHPEIFEPHVQPEDLHWRKAESVMYDIDPRLAWWRDLDYVGIMHSGKPVTFNLIDIAMSYRNNYSYNERAVFHFRESLWNELFIRYMGQKTLEHQILLQLDNSILAPETIFKTLNKGNL